MACFRLPKWVIYRIDKIRRDFLWKRNEEQSQGAHLINWDAICLPKIWGGLGIPDLETRNVALLMRWWWRLTTESDSLWAIVVMRIRWIGDYINGPRIRAISGSFFWNQLIKIHPLFQQSTSWDIGAATGISYWYDAWSAGALARLGPRQERPSQPLISLADARLISHVFAPDNDELSNLSLNEQEDRLIWKWERNGEYTARSMYKILIGVGKIRWPYMETLKSKLPPTARVFAVLMLRDKLLTHEVMDRRNMHCESHCLMCNYCSVESAAHLLFCVLLQCMCGTWYRTWWDTDSCSPRVRQVRSGTPHGQLMWGQKKKGEWIVQFGATLWALWRHRNSVVFGVDRLPPVMLAERAF